MDKRSDIQNYWYRKMRDPMVMCLAQNTIMAYYDFHFMFKEGIPFLPRLMAVILTIVSSTIFILALRNAKYAHWVRFAFMACLLRYIAYPFDLAKIQPVVTETRWQISCGHQTALAVMGLFFHYYGFNHEERGHQLFGIIYLNLIYFGIIYGASWEKYFETASSFSYAKIPLLQVAAIALAKSQNIHSKFLDYVFRYVENQKFLTLVLDSLQECIVLLDEEKRLVYSNPMFRSLFAEPIAFANKVAQERRCEKKEADKEVQRTERRESPTKHLLTKIRQVVCSLLGCFCRKDEEVVPEVLGENFIDCGVFRYLKMLRKLQQCSEGAKEIKLSEDYYCFADLLMNIEASNGRTYMFNPYESGHSLANSEDKSTHEDSERANKYIKVNFLKLQYQNSSRLFIQIADVSDRVLYDKSKEEKELLALINATVSHELRNPLNSIMAQNTAKESHYADIITELENVKQKIPPEVGSKIQAIMEDLNQGLGIQNSSAKLMSFLVQDFLDYAQLQSDKFRMNIGPFCIKETVKQVISIQIEKAIEKKVGLFSTYDLCQDDSIIYSDQQRIMQVLLNLQSNALKFTQAGSVEIAVKVEQKPTEKEQVLKVRVIDTGVGIPEQDQSKLFKLFGFVQSTQGLNKNGIGLGLMISKRIVHKFGGEIGFTSVPQPQEEHGTIFHFTIPLATKEEYLESQHRQNQGPSKYQINSSHLLYEWEPSAEDRSFDTAEKKGRVWQQAHFSSPFLNESIGGDSMRLLTPYQQHLRKPSMASRIYTSHRSGQLSEIEVESPLQCVHPTPMLLKKMTDDTEYKQQEEEEEPSSEISTSPSVLIVDDQSFNITALKTILKFKLGVREDQTESALDGKEALDKVKQRLYSGHPPYKLILMDCNMPFMDGYEATSKIRSLYYRELGLGIRQQPIITAVTGHAEPKHIEKCFRFGMNQVLSKPVNHEALKFVCLETGVSEEAVVAAIEVKYK